MKKFLLSLAILFSFYFKAQVGAFSFNISGNPPAGFAQALTIAGQKWSNYIQINIPIKVNVNVINTSLAPFSAITFANGRKNFPNAPYPNLLYTTSLANQLAGSVTNPGEFDMDIYFNLNTNFYFGTGKPPANQEDLISTAMHEIGHGLGFYSDGYVDANGKGSFGNIPSSAIFPATTSFPWRGQDSVPSIFDKYMVKADGNHMTTCAPQNSTALGDSIKNGAIYFSGPIYANPSHSNTPIRLAGGAGTYTLGEDLLHIHQSYANTIMSYYWGAGDTVRIPAPWELGILREIGWNLNLVGIHENSNANSSIHVYPTPANETIYIAGKNIKEIRLYTIMGELIQVKENELKEEEIRLNTENLTEGVYFFKISFTNNEQIAVKKSFVRR